MPSPSPPPLRPPPPPPSITTAGASTTTAMGSSLKIYRAVNEAKRLPPLIKPDDFSTTIWHSPLSPNTPLDTMPTAELSLKKSEQQQQFEFGMDHLRAMEVDEDVDNDPASTEGELIEDSELEMALDLMEENANENSNSNDTILTTSPERAGSEEPGPGGCATLELVNVKKSREANNNKHIAILSGENNHDMVILFLTE